MALIYVLLIVNGLDHGLHGVNGPHVLKFVEMDYKKERGLWKSLQQIVEGNVLAVTGEQGHVIVNCVMEFINNIKTVVLILIHVVPNVREKEMESVMLMLIMLSVTLMEGTVLVSDFTLTSVHLSQI